MGINSGEIRKIIEKSTSFRGELKDDDVFTDAGIDSLDLFSILMGIEERYGLKIPDEDTADLRSIQGILTYLEGRLG